MPVGAGSACHLTVPGGGDWLIDAGTAPFLAGERWDSGERRILPYLQANGIRRLALFGSVLRDDFRPESDIDVLVEFQPGVHVGLAFIRLQDELSAILHARRSLGEGGGHPVDLNTPGSLSKYFRDEVLKEAEALYVAA